MITAAQYMAPKLNTRLRTTAPESLPGELLDKYANAMWELTSRAAFEAFAAISRREHPA